MNPKVDWYFEKSEKWQEEIRILRSIALSCGLTEELKWGCPCYTYKETNVVLIHVFKEYCAYLFFKGALLQNENGILVQQTKNVQSARQARFTGWQEIKDKEPLLKACIYEAIEVEKAGLKIELKQTSEFTMPEEFQTKLDENKDLKTAFESLTPGRQRDYLLYFSQPRQSKTRQTRIEKSMQPILDGKGLND